MKSAIISSAIIIIAVLFVLCNCVFLSSELENYVSRLESAEELSEIYYDFKNKKAFLSLTLTDDEVEELDSGFNECIILYRSGELGEAEKEKSRLINKLLQIKRLSGINFLSIF